MSINSPHHQDAISLADNLSDRARNLAESEQRLAQQEVEALFALAERTQGAFDYLDLPEVVIPTAIERRFRVLAQDVQMQDMPVVSRVDPGAKRHLIATRRAVLLSPEGQIFTLSTEAIEPYWIVSGSPAEHPAAKPIEEYLPSWGGYMDQLKAVDASQATATALFEFDAARMFDDLAHSLLQAQPQISAQEEKLVEKEAMHAERLRRMNEHLSPPLSVARDVKTHQRI